MLLRKLSSLVLVPLAVFGGAVSLDASPLIFLSPQIVLSTDVASGPSFFVPSALLSTDTLSLTVDGLVCLQPGGKYCTNAAGVVVVAGSRPIGGSLQIPPAGPIFGSLLLGNTTLGFFQVFDTNAANGLGSGAPPASLSQTITLGALGFAAGIPAGSTLQWRVADQPSQTGDNSGGFLLTSTIPEPSSILLLGFGLVGFAAWRRRQA